MTRRRRRVVGGTVAVLVVLFLSVKLVSPRSGPGIESGSSDAPFGPFAGYSRTGNVHSVGGSFTVPRVAPGSAPGQAGTWIGVQGQGPPSRFVQIGAIEGLPEPDRKPAYVTFWSDTARHYEPKVLFAVGPGDTLAASITRANKGWALAINDETSGKKGHFSIGDDTDAPFDQAEWTQEDPGRENDHAPYPQMAPPVFRHLTVNSTAPSQAALDSRWMSVNHGNLAPTPVRDDSFTLGRAPAVSVAAEQYLRLTAAAGTAYAKFELERAGWTAKTPYDQIATASTQLITATQDSLRSLLAARWSQRIRRLVRSDTPALNSLIERAKPPTVLTPASFAAWNSKLTETNERAAPVGATLRLALGLPGAGPAYHR
jgi:hypothetical protein